MADRAKMDADPFGQLRGRRVLVTGHTGFKGGWLCLWLKLLGAQVTGIALPAPAGPSFHDAIGLAEIIDGRFADVRDSIALQAAAAGVDAELLIHMAAQSLVRRSHGQPGETFATNVMGTANVLDLARSMPSLRAVLVVTSDKCYENNEWAWPYRETDQLGGSDPYSASKACAELVTASYARTYFSLPASPQLATVRAGNVIGGGDWAEDRLVPDIIRALYERRTPLIRNPRSVRPWQHVLEPLCGYLQLADRLLSDGGGAFAGAWNFGPDAAQSIDVETLARAVMRAAGDGKAAILLGSEPSPIHEAAQLRLDSSKARSVLGWRPRLSNDEMLEWTASWYSAYIEGGTDMRAFSAAQISSFSLAETVEKAASPAGRDRVFA